MIETRRLKNVVIFLTVLLLHATSNCYSNVTNIDHIITSLSCGGYLMVKLDLVYTYLFSFLYPLSKFAAPPSRLFRPLCLFDFT